MAKAIKTQPTGKSVSDYIDSLPDERQRKDARELVKMMEKATKAKGKMWGTSIVGFGDYRYKYASGREGDWFYVGFAPRKRNLTLYIMPGFERYEDLLEKLGKHSIGKSCLYVNSLGGLHMPTLRKLVNESVKHMKKMHP